MGTTREVIKFAAGGAGVIGMFVGGIQGFVQERHADAARDYNVGFWPTIGHVILDQPHFVRGWIIPDSESAKELALPENRELLPLKNAGTEELVLLGGLGLAAAAVKAKS